MIRRQTLGPEIAYERTGAELFREARPMGARVADGLKGPASGVILAAAAIAAAAEPATVDILLPVSLFYGAWVLTRRVILPLRLPKGAMRKDYNHPLPGRRLPRRAEGIVYIGNDYKTQQELWIGNEECASARRGPGHDGCRQDRRPAQPGVERANAR